MVNIEKCHKPGGLNKQINLWDQALSLVHELTFWSQFPMIGCRAQPPFRILRHVGPAFSLIGQALLTRMGGLNTSEEWMWVGWAGCEQVWG